MCLHRSGKFFDKGITASAVLLTLFLIQWKLNTKLSHSAAQNVEDQSAVRGDTELRAVFVKQNL